MLAFLRAILSGEISAVLDGREEDFVAEGKETAAVTAAAMAAGEGEDSERERERERERGRLGREMEEQAER